MSDLQAIAFLVVVAYAAIAVLMRGHFIARASIQALRGRIDELRASARLRGAVDGDPVLDLLTNAEVAIKDVDRWWRRLISTGAAENRGWTTVHHAERLLLSLKGYEPAYLYARLRREAAELSVMPAAMARVWTAIVARHLDERLDVRPSSDRVQAEADLSQLLGRANRASDAYYTALAELYNKSSWLIFAGLVFIVAVIAAQPSAIPLLGLGAIGGLTSRIMRISSASSLPADYGALWAPLFLSPVLGALLGWTGVLLLELGRAVDVIALRAIDLTDTTSGPVLALALLFGFTERFFNGVANVIAAKVLGGPGSGNRTSREPPRADGMSTVPISGPSAEGGAEGDGGRDLEDGEEEAEQGQDLNGRERTTNG